MEKVFNRSVLLVTICFFLAACESSSDRSSSDAEVENDPPRLTDTVPGDGASEVDTQENIVLRFSEIIDQDSLNSGGIRLFVEQEEQATRIEVSTELDIVADPDDADENILLDVSVVDVTTAQNRFALSTEYSLKVTSDVFDNDSNDPQRLQTNFDIEFLTRDGDWQQSARVDLPSTGNVFDPQLTSNRNGDVFVVWRQSNGSVSDIWASRYNVGSGVILDSFTAPSDDNLVAELVETNNSGNALAPIALVTSSGYLVVAWELADGSARSIRANVFDGNTWLGETEIEDVAGDASDIVLVEDGTGAVIAAWRQSDGDRFSIWSSSFELANVDIAGGLDGWTEPERIEGADTLDLGDALSPSLATNSQGLTVLTWSQPLDDVNRVWSAIYDLTSGWAAVETFDAGNGERAENPHMAFGPSGDGMAVWQQFDGDRYNIWANRIVGRFWGTPELIETDNRGDATDPVVEFDDQQKAIAVWAQDQGSLNSIVASEFSLADGWTAVETIGTTLTPIGAPELNVDSEGNAIAIWDQGIGSTSSVFANRFSQFNGWQGTLSVEDFNIAKATDPKLTEFFADGRQLAVWYQIEEDGTYRMAMNTFR